MLGNCKTILTVNTLNNNSNKTKETNSSELLIKNRLLKFYRISKINTNSDSTVLKVFEEKQTQTEEKFFMFHWKKFIGIYKIVTAKVTEHKSVISLGFPLLLKHYRINCNKKKNISKSSSCIVSTSSQNIFFKENQTNKNNNSITKIGRNENQFNGIFHSHYDKTDFIKSLMIKNEYKKLNDKDKNHNKTEKDNTVILVNENYIQCSNTKRIENIKKRTSSMKKLVTRFVSGIKNIKKNDFLNQYLVDEKRIIDC